MAERLPSCPCGQTHDLGAARRAYEQATAGRPPNVLVQANSRAWYVPRIFIAVHGLKADELPGVAARYGFRPGPVISHG